MGLLKSRSNYKQCSTCNALNPIGAKNCQQCGESFSYKFDLTLEEALRAGAIIRGMDIEESEVQEAEEMASEVRRKILRKHLATRGAEGPL